MQNQQQCSSLGTLREISHIDGLLPYHEGQIVQRYELRHHYFSRGYVPGMGLPFSLCPIERCIIELLLEDWLNRSVVGITQRDA